MRIGTGQPSAEQLEEVKHYFIDEFPVSAMLTAADYESMALKYLDEIFTTRETAVVCGGTGLYINALCKGMDIMPPVDAVITLQVENEYRSKGIPWLQQAVETEDPGFYENAESQNPARLVRALSFIRSTGHSISDFRTRTSKVRPFQITTIGLELPREQLYAHINQRVDFMIENGLIEEARLLFPFRHLKNLQTVGYSELFSYMEGKMSLKDAIDKIKQHTRNYAKRQLTWFKKDQETTWFAASDANLTEKILNL